MDSKQSRRKKIAVEIYMLSVILSQIQTEYTETTEGDRSSSWGRTLNRLAILLTRGTKAEASRTVTVAAGRLTTDGVDIKVLLASPSESPEERNNSQTRPISLSCGQESPPNEIALPSVFDSFISDARGHIKSSEGSIDDASDVYVETESDDPIVFRPAEEYPDFRAFTQALLRVNRASARLNKHISSAYFAVSQCSRKAFSRSKAVCDIFKLEGDLPSWRPLAYENEDIISETISHKANTLYSHLFKHELPGKEDPSLPGSWMYTFDSSNCHCWLLALIAAVVDLRDALQSLIQSQRELIRTKDSEAKAGLRRDCQDRTIAATKCSILLHTLLGFIPKAFWDIESLDHFLRDCEWSVVRVVVAPADDNVEGPPEEDVIEEDGRDWIVPYKWQTNEKGTIGDLKDSRTFRHASGCLKFIRAVDSLTEWTTSAFALSKSKFGKSDIPLHLTVYDLPHRQPEDIPLDHVSRAIDDWTASSYFDAEKAKPMIMDAWEAGSGGHLGSCHCEAAIMADEAERGGFLNGSCTGHLEFGVAKKLCPFCKMLQESMEDYSELRIRLSGSHGRFSPWYPPDSLTMDVLFALRCQAKVQLSYMLQNSYDVDSSDDDDRFALVS